MLKIVYFGAFERTWGKGADIVFLASINNKQKAVASDIKGADGFTDWNSLASILSG